ncbi:hypothetical protein O7631_16520 [Micromonospora sp. WMMD967]|nr:hypothetical protein [Micromonospora sp. WMMD967]MDG4838126.1 hypothetical protein [Micromonospora sp. WMMD967]
MNIGIDGSAGPQAGYNRTFGLRKQNSNGVWTFLNPRTGSWTGTSH